MKRGVQIAAVLLLLLASPAFAAGEFDMGTVLGAYQASARNFGTAITSASLKVCYALFTIDLAWMLVTRMLKGSDVVELGVATIMRVVWLGFVVWIITNAAVPLAFVDGFIQLGKTGANVTASSPSDVFWLGIDVVNKMNAQFADQSSVLDIFPALLLFGVDLIVVFCFAFLAAQFAVAWIQLWFFLGVYPIVVAFGVTRFTKDMAMKVFTTPIVYGVRFLALYFVIAGAMSFGTWLGGDIAHLKPSNLSPLWAVAGTSIILMLLAMKAPQMASDLLSGTASLSAGDGVGAGLVAGGALAAAAGGAYAAGSKVANGVAGAVKAGQAGIAQAREKGASGIMGTAAGAAGAVGGAVGEAAMKGIRGLGGESMGGRLAGRMDTATAGIREAKAAGASAPSVPGGQPPAPLPSPSGEANSAPSVEAPAALDAGAPAQPASGDSEATAPTRETPPAPVAEASAPAQLATATAASSGSTAGASAPAATTEVPPSSVQPGLRATPPAPAAEGEPAGETGIKAPAAAPTAPGAAPEVSAASPSIEPPAEAGVAPVARVNEPSTGATPTAAVTPSKTALAAKAVLTEVQKTSGSEGGSVQTSHGDE